MLALLSHYRSAELHGAELLLRLMRMMQDDADAQVKLTRHVADETRHAWLWTQRMHEIGGRPVPIAPDYQARIGMRTIPRRLADLLALTIVVEARSLARYDEHAARPDVDEVTRTVLRSVSSDEKWHLAWLQGKLADLTANDPDAQERVTAMTERYRRIDEEVYAELRAIERHAFGDGAGDPVSQRRG